MKPASYDTRRTYAWNYENCPEPPLDLAGNGAPSSSIEQPNWDQCGQANPQTGSYQFLGLPVASPLGIAAGPLLNGRWVLYYAKQGFDVLTYKTVRTEAVECYQLPNLVPVQPPLSPASRDDAVEWHLNAPGEHLTSTSDMHGSWAISFGMPSKPPGQWMDDVAQTKRHLPAGKILSVSVVATPKPHWTAADLARDYAQCAAMAVESGADCVEANFSCPNVSSIDGQLYQNPELSRQVAEEIRRAIGTKPLAIKIGYVASRHQAAELIDAIGSEVQGISMTNCIAATVQGPHGKYFEGQPRGIGGLAIRQASVNQTRMFAEQIGGTALQLIGVGGVATIEHVQQYLDAGAHAVHVATAAMLNPDLGIALQRGLADA